MACQLGLPSINVILAWRQSGAGRGHPEHRIQQWVLDLENYAPCPLPLLCKHHANNISPSAQLLGLLWAEACTRSGSGLLWRPSVGKRAALVALVCSGGQAWEQAFVSGMALVALGPALEKRVSPAPCRRGWHMAWHGLLERTGGQNISGWYFGLFEHQ